MKYVSYITTVIIAGIVTFGCSTTPNGPDFSEQFAEFNALETELSSLEIETEPKKDHAITDINIKRLKNQILHLRRFLERLAKYEKNHPNDEAHTLIRQAIHFANSALEAFEKEEYRKAYRLLRRARQLAHDALKILRPVTDKAPDGA